MANLKNPYEDLTNVSEAAPSTTGTWSYTGTGSTGAAPLPPAPPALYDDDIDFEGVAAGTYPYTYTVTDCDGGDVTATVTYTLTNRIAVKNDECSGSRLLVFPYQGGVSKLTEQTLAGNCPGLADPTYSVAPTHPTGWGSSSNFSADTWYKVSFDADYPVPPIIVMSITVDGSPYGAEGVYEPFIAIHPDCSTAALDSETPFTGSQEVTIVRDSVFNADFTYYIRVSCHTGNEGKFDISITV